MDVSKFNSILMQFFCIRICVYIIHPHFIYNTLYIFGTNFVFSLKFCQISNTDVLTCKTLVLNNWMYKKCSGMKVCCMMSHNTEVSTSRHVAFFTSRFIAASPFISWKTVCFKLQTCHRSTAEYHTLAWKLTGSSKNTIVTSVPQMHLLNAEIDVSTKAKILCCMFLSCHDIVWYCKIIVCPNLHYKMFFPT